MLGFLKTTFFFVYVFYQRIWTPRGFTHLRLYECFYYTLCSCWYGTLLQCVASHVDAAVLFSSEIFLQTDAMVLFFGLKALSLFLLYFSGSIECLLFFCWVSRNECRNAAIGKSSAGLPLLCVNITVIPDSMIYWNKLEQTNAQDIIIFFCISILLVFVFNFPPPHHHVILENYNSLF